jgi:hypothetical protein
MCSKEPGVGIFEIYIGNLLVLLAFGSGAIAPQSLGLAIRPTKFGHYEQKHSGDSLGAIPNQSPLGADRRCLSINGFGIKVARGERERERERDHRP